MKRETRYQVYVDAPTMTSPPDLCDAVMAHFIKKKMDIAKRRRFLVEYMRADTEAEALEAINRWVLVKDIANFPLRYEDDEENTDADEATEGGIPVDDSPEPE